MKDEKITISGMWDGPHEIKAIDDKMISIDGTHYPADCQFIQALGCIPDNCSEETLVLCRKAREYNTGELPT